MCRNGAEREKRRERRRVKVFKASRAVRFASASLLAIFAAAPASAQIVDVAKISCKQYLAGNLVRQDYLTLWLSGYVNGTRNDTVIETSTVQTIANKVGTYCRSNLDSGLMDAVQNVLGISK
jgi:acid stress chaperone HdeB